VTVPVGPTRSAARWGYNAGAARDVEDPLAGLQAATSRRLADAGVAIAGTKSRSQFWAPVPVKLG
jgi:hypothetical protein